MALTILLMTLIKPEKLGQYPFLRVIQITKESRGSLPSKGADDGKPSSQGTPEANGNHSPRSASPRRSSGAVEVPEVATLLEFVAWVVLCDVPATARSANWFKGRGGFLADQLDAVREASIRIQVPILSCNHHPFA